MQWFICVMLLISICVNGVFYCSAWLHISHCAIRMGVHQVHCVQLLFGINEVKYALNVNDIPFPWIHSDQLIL